MRINRKEFSRRRAQLMRDMEDNSIAILPSATMKCRNRDTDYAFRQDSDFLYLTGFEEPDAVAVLIPGREHGEYIIFCRERNPEKEIWDGYMAGPEGACKKFGAEDAFPISCIDDILPGLIEGRERLYYNMGGDADFDRMVMEWVNTIRSKARSGAHPPGEFISLDLLVHEMRLFKSSAEVKVMQEAAEISAGAHCRAMKICQEGMTEYQLEAEYLHEFARHGAQSPAYTSIVGSGKNACILHYIENTARLKSGDLVLIDAGCELDYYASDITRTFPVNGRFTEAQKIIYELVLKAQLAAIEKIKPGNTWNQPHEKTVEIITAGLLELGILKGDIKTLIAEEGYKKFYMHRAGHWLGMDVHDVGDYKVNDCWRILEPGMVLTVEPGIYIAPGAEGVAKKWQGIGVRIEDDVLVTRAGYKVLSSDAPKTVKDIEKIMRRRKKPVVKKQERTLPVKSKAKSKVKSKPKVKPKVKPNVKPNVKVKVKVKTKPKVKTTTKSKSKVVKEKTVRKKVAPKAGLTRKVK